MKYESNIGEVFAINCVVKLVSFAVALAVVFSQVTVKARVRVKLGFRNKQNISIVLFVHTIFTLFLLYCPFKYGAVSYYLNKNSPKHVFIYFV